jgi:hypothetical protein
VEHTKNQEHAHAPEGERIGPSDPVGVANTLGELMMIHLARLNPSLPIFSGLSKERGIALLPDGTEADAVYIVFSKAYADFLEHARVHRSQALTATTQNASERR